MMQELIHAHDGFKIIQNLCKNDIIEFIFYVSTNDIIYNIYFSIIVLEIIYI